ncbi:pyrokinin-1 receptor-like [Planococcus citri]|uniref:pyrokinin-1 receptor-like n=1 Tax=Planococcus citri TaxID=170843 RepID=UPI0031F9E0BB
MKSLNCSFINCTRTVTDNELNSTANHNLTKHHRGFNGNILDSGADFVEELVLRDSLYVVIPLTVLYSFILIAGISGNLINCWVITKIKRMHTTTNYYLFSLSVSDLLLLTSGLPQEIYLIWFRYPYIFGETFCVLRGLMAETSTNATVLTITAFSFERYIAICHPFLAYSVTNLTRTVRLILLIWVLALVFAAPQAFQFGLVAHGGPETLQCTLKRIILPHSFELSTIFFFIVPMILITYLYAMIGIKLKKSGKMKPSLKRKSLYNGNASSANTSRSSMFSQQRPERKISKMLIAVVVTFFLCWAPFHAQRLVAMYGTNSSLMMKIYDVVTYVSAIMYYTSSMMNPLLYQITSRKFRDAFKESIGLFYSRTPQDESCK